MLRPLLAALFRGGLVPVAGLLLATAPPAPAKAATDICAVPKDLMQDQSPLPGTAAAIENKRPLRIVAIGSNSTLGRPAGGPDHAYPHYLEQDLRARLPVIAVTVVNRAELRQSAEDMVARFAKDVLSENPTLVIWEVGTKEAARGSDPEVLGANLQAGLNALQKRNIDVIVMDMQYSRTTATMINFAPYLAAVHQVADGNDVQIFRRHAMMKYWSDNDIFDYDQVPLSGRREMAEQVYRCIARRLADTIANASR